ncbi:MAG TPA: hypothetical protein VIW94_03500 [Acidimicrobiia bacterium]
MDELFRYQQLRQSEKLSGEQKRLVGLPLYPDPSYSDLANDLIALNAVDAEDESVRGLLDEYARAATIVDSTAHLHSAINAVYEWLTFKAWPIKPTDFRQFISSSQLEPFDLEEEWKTCADNLLVAIYQNNLSINHCVDYQLLIRICYLLKLCTVEADGKIHAAKEIPADLLAAILEVPVLLPALVLRSRCSGDCRSKGKVAVPRVPEVRETSDHRDPCECSCDESCQEPSSYCICINTYVAELFVIKEELARYEEGDIAAIENVLVGEKKVRRHRTLLRTEETSETEEETITSEERDHQVSEKSSLQEEVKSMIESRVGIDAGVTSNIKYGKAVTITPHANVTANYSKSKAQSVARAYSKDIVDRSVTKLQEKVRKVQVSRILNEMEERNKHSIDNTKDGADHRAGIFYWVNKVTHAQVFNYGKHMMFDAIIPEPAATFKRLFELKNQTDNQNLLPEKPTLTLMGITRNNYVQILHAQGLSGAIEPPEERTAIQFAFHQNLTEPEDEVTTGFSSAEFKSEPIPDGYKADSFDFSIKAFVGDPAAQSGTDEASLSVSVGNTALLSEVAPYGGLQQTNDWSAAGTDVPLNGETGVITASVAGYSSVAMQLSGTISIKCSLTAATFDKWRLSIYNLVMTDYVKKLEVYEANKKQDPLIQIEGRNPFLNREIERNELKRHIIAMLMCNYFNGVGSMMERTAPCGYPEIDFAKLAKDSPVIQFFEQVFEWHYVNYLFYHSMWARKCKWPALIDEDSGDPLFDKFLTAGAARVQVPIRSGMEEYFSWFLKTGQIWGASGIPPVSGDDEYVSMIQELKESKQGDYSDRPGLIEATKDSDLLKLTESGFYWDFVNDQINTLAVDNDRDRELLLNFEEYRIVNVEQTATGDPYAWTIKIDRPYPGASATSLKHAVGALYVGAPWEVVIPTKLVYLRNPNDKLPNYPLS